MLVENKSSKCKRLILHIGHPKTGTTTLQKTLQASRPALLDAGIFHPDTGAHHNHKVLIPYLTHGASPAKQLESAQSEAIQNSSKKWTGVVDDVRTFKPNTIILSSEGLFQCMEADAFRNLISHLKPLASEIVIAAYLREPASFALSRSQQNIKRHPNFTLPSKDYYRSVLEAYQASGLGSIKVRALDRSTLKNGDIVEDFFAQHVQDFDLERLLRRKDDNTTFSAEAMALIQEVNRKERSFPWGKARLAIETADRQLHGFTRPRMHDHVHHAIQARCTDLDWLKDEFDLEFPGINTGSMPLGEANRVCDALDRTEDMCIVNADRKAALWSAVRKDHSPLHRLLRKIRKKD